MFSLVGCNNKNKKPADLDEQIYQDALAAINITDQYLEGDISISDLEERLKDFKNYIYDDCDYENDTTINILVSGDIATLIMQTSVSTTDKYLNSARSNTSDNDYDYRNGIREYRDKLAERINYGK